MNKDIRLSIGFLDHPKTIKLKRKLGHDGIECILRLWFFAAQYKCTGALSDMDMEDVELTTRWSGEPGLLVSTLIQLRFLDLVDGTYVLHDWKEHNGYAFHAEDRAERSRHAANVKWDRIKNSINSTTHAARNASGNASGNAERNAARYAPSPTPSPAPSPSPKEKRKESYASECPQPPPSSPQISASELPDAAHSLSFPPRLKDERPENIKTRRNRSLSGSNLDGFLQFWEAFDYKRGRSDAADAWLDIQGMNDDLLAQIIEAARREKLQRSAIVRAGGIAKMAHGWLAGRRWEDDPLEVSDPIMDWANGPDNPDPLGLAGMVHANAKA